MSADFLAALLIGLLGSSHCLVMCGGIASALQLSVPTAQRRQGWYFPLLLSAGRLTTYALLGALVGYFGITAMQVTGASMLWLRLVSGLLLITMALYISRLWFGLTLLERLGQGLWRRLQPLSHVLLPLDSASKAYRYGLLWGFLPCGLVYSTLSWSLASGSAKHGALLMLCFGIGTLPAILALGSAANALKQLKANQLFRYATAAILAIYGFYTIWLALQRLVF
jgi:sulfite exporter TauE/SafE